MNTLLYQAKALTQTAGSRDKHVNHEAIVVLQKPRSQSAEAYVVACTLKLNLKGFVSMARICLDLLAQFGVKHKSIDVFQHAFRHW